MSVALGSFLRSICTVLCHPSVFAPARMSTSSFRAFGTPDASNAPLYASNASLLSDTPSEQSTVLPNFADPLFAMPEYDPGPARRRRSLLLRARQRPRGSRRPRIIEPVQMPLLPLLSLQVLSPRARPKPYLFPQYLIPIHSILATKRPSSASIKNT